MFAYLPSIDLWLQSQCIHNTSLKNRDGCNCTHCTYVNDAFDSVEPSTPHHNSNTFFLSLLTSRWRGRNHLSYLRAKSHYDSQPGEASEHPLIYDDANIHFYRGNNAYLLEPGNQRCPAAAILPAPSASTSGMVRDTSGLSQQVGLPSQ